GEKGLPLEKKRRFDAANAAFDTGTNGVFGVNSGMDIGFFGTGANTGDVGFGPGSAGGFDNGLALLWQIFRAHAIPKSLFLCSWLVGFCVQPMAKRLALGAWDQLLHFIGAGVWDAPPVETELLVQADNGAPPPPKPRGGPSALAGER